MPGMHSAIYMQNFSRNKACILKVKDGGDDLWARADACGADLLAPHVTLLDDRLRRGALDRDRPMLVWMVNDPGSITLMLRDPAVGWLVTDEPALAQRLRTEL